MGKIIENYSIQEQLGEGVYGKVYRASHIHTKVQVAIKVIHADKFKEIPKLEECTVNQINILSTMQNCPYIVKYIDMLKTVNNFYFVYEFCNGGTLDKLMQKEGPFPEKRAITYFRQMVEAFKVLTKGNIMHRDLKPDNILMHNGSIKLGDFGFCKPLENALDMANTMLGSPIYMAPQVLKGETYNMKADIWSLGVVLFQMIYGRCPFESKSIAKLIKLLDEENLSIPEQPKISPNLEKLLKRMLVKDFNTRIDWNQIFEYTFTETGEIYAPKSQQTMNQFQLRSSIKSTSNFGMFNPNNIYNNSTVSTTNSNSSHNLNHSTNIHTNGITSPKLSNNKSYDMGFDQIKNMNPLMTKKSPNKPDNDISVSSEYKGQQFYRQNNKIYAGKNDRTGRLDMLIKSHGKCASINQIAYDCISSQKQRPASVAVSYLLFKNVDKQMGFIADSLKKQSYDSRSDEFKQLIQQQTEKSKQILGNFKETLQQQDLISLVGNIEQPNKMRVMKAFFEGIKLQIPQDAILAAQIIDYLDEGMLIKKDSYERMGKQTLHKQIKGKYAKYL